MAKRFKNNKKLVWKKIIENGLLSIFIVYSIITAPFIIKDLGLWFHNLPSYFNNKEVYGNYVAGEIRIYGNKIQDWRGIIKVTIHEAGHYYYWREMTAKQRDRYARVYNSIDWDCQLNDNVKEDFAYSFEDYINSKINQVDNQLCQEKNDFFDELELDYRGYNEI